MAKRAPGHRARAARDLPVVRDPQQIASDLVGEKTSNIHETVEHFRTHGVPIGNTAAAALEALFWIARARERGWAWRPTYAAHKGAVETIPDRVEVPGWVVEELAAAWVGFSREKSPPTLDEAFGVKLDGGLKHIAERRKTERDQFTRALQVEDVKRRTGVGEVDARSAVAEHVGVGTKTIAKDQKRFGDLISSALDKTDKPDAAK